MLVIRSQKPEKIVQKVRETIPSAQGTPGDIWKQYLQENNGTGSTFHDLEMSYLLYQSYTGWDKFLLAAGLLIGTVRESIRRWLTNIVTSSPSYYLLEDGTSKYVLEDGSGFYILE